MYENGGPVLMLQIENEYGSMGICDKVYLAWLVISFLIEPIGNGREFGIHFVFRGPHTPSL